MSLSHIASFQKRSAPQVSGNCCFVVFLLFFIKKNILLFTTWVPSEPIVNLKV